MVESFINKKASDSPVEHKEEIRQEAALRIISSYGRLDCTKGWKSFVFNHARGAVMDYKKFGRGFKEDSWKLREDESETTNMVSRVIMNFNLNQDDKDFDSYLSDLGIFSKDPDEILINWDLVSRMATDDESIHIFAKWIRGFEINEMANIFGMSRTRIFQLVQAFLVRFKNADENKHDPWFRQICFAFGISELFDLPLVDESKRMRIPIGWSSRAVDLDSVQPIHIETEQQLSFFGDL